MSETGTMDARQIIELIAKSEKKTPVKVWIQKPVDNVPESVMNFGNVLIGDWKDISPLLQENGILPQDCWVENASRNSAIPLLDTKGIQARIEPGAIIRDHVEIQDRAIIMMGAVINIGAIIGEGSMIDMNAVLGGRAQVGKNCHVGAGAVLAGVVEPASAKPVILEDNVLVGANAVVLEGVHIGKNAVVAAGSVVTEDVPENAVVAGMPAKIVKTRDEKTDSKTGLEQDLRTL